MDNYYDTIKLLSLHNINIYKPIKITLENKIIKIPEIIKDIKVNTYPIQGILFDLFYEIRK